jgi:hypothetical protein
MSKINSIQESGAARIRVDKPLAKDATAAVIIAQSGRMGRYDQPGYEAELYERLVGQFVGEGLVAIRFDAEQGMPKPERSTGLRRAERSRRLTNVLLNASDLIPANRFVLLGLSLGALSIVDVLAREHLPNITGALLIGCVLETPSIVMHPLGRLELVYGAGDLVAYMDEEGRYGNPATPSQYSKNTADNLIVMPRTEIGTHIVDGVGHLLERPNASSPSDNVLDLLVTLTCGLARSSRAANGRFP